MENNSQPCANPNSFCSQIAPELRLRLCSVCTPVHYSKYKRLYHPSYNPRIFIIKEGVAVQKLTFPNGRAVGLSFDGPGCVQGSVYSSSTAQLFPHRVSYSEVIQPLSGGLITVADAKNLCNKYPDLTKVFLENMEVYCARLIEYSYYLATSDSTEKLVYILTQMKKQGIGLDELTHEDIASLLNMNRVTVTKTMKSALIQMHDDSSQQPKIV